MMTTHEATAYLADLSGRLGVGQTDEGKRTVYGMLASKALGAGGIGPDLQMGQWMRALCDDLGMTGARQYGVVAVAQRLAKWLDE